MNPRRLAFVLLLALAAAGCGKTPRIAPLGPNDVVLAFGDSLTYGTGATENESYPAVLAQLVNRKVVRSGVPGETTDGALARLESVLDEHRPALVIFSLGGNDMLRKASDATVKENLRRIVRTIQARRIAVMLFGVPKPGIITSAPEFYAEVAEEFGIPYEGKIVTSVLYSPSEKSDPIHPNAKGYRRMAEAFAKLLKSSGAI
jgi:lysophospholipase L1-like esterase